MAEDQRSTLGASLCVARKISSVINSVAKITALSQHRTQSILDIAGRVVQTESIGEFLDEIPPYSRSDDKRCRSWRRRCRSKSNNPFHALAKADNMTKVKVVRPFATDNLTSEMGLGLRVQRKPTGGGGREILRDRELSELVDSQAAASTVTQAGRMGTAEFMSVNLLDHTDRPVKVSDELDSFFRLLVYCSVRHLGSNRTRTASWIDNYFSSYTGPERLLCRGEKSCTVEVSGTLQMRYPDGASVTFRSPMDSVLAPILKRFRAHYKVMEHDAANPRPAPRPETSLPLLASTAPRILLRDYDEDDEDDEDVDEEEIAEWEAELQASLRAHIPTAEDRELAKTVADHEFMLGHLAKMLRDPRWRANDHIPKPVPPKVPSTKSNPNGLGQPSEPTLRENSKKRRERPGLSATYPFWLARAPRPDTRRAKSRERTLFARGGSETLRHTRVIRPSRYLHSSLISRFL